MAEKTFTGNINTEGQWETLASLTSLSFSDGEQYTIYIGGVAQVKVGDAIFPVHNQTIYWTPSGAQMYICNTLNPLSITVYGAN